MNTGRVSLSARLSGQLPCAFLSGRALVVECAAPCCSTNERRASNLASTRLRAVVNPSEGRSFASADPRVMCTLEPTVTNT